jgi:hypothetical protein
MVRWLWIVVGVGCSSPSASPLADAARSPDVALDSLDACFASVTRPSSRFIDVQSYASADGRYQLRRARRPGDRVSVGETFPYDLIRFGATIGGEVTCVDRPMDLSYDYGHHNWDDTMEARAASATYRINERFAYGADSAWSFTLTVLDPAGRVVAGPLPLTDTGCHTLPFDLNGCPGRMRTDR